MASLSASQDTLFVSPENLMINHQLDNSLPGQKAPEPAFLTEPRPDQQQRSLPGDEQRPSLSLPAFFEWSGQLQQDFRPNLPPTPSSPFLPSRPLTEDEKLAFPCLGGPQDCWNLRLCPKHRQYPATPPERNDNQSSRQQTALCDARRQSVPAKSTASGTDIDKRTKIQRHATDPEDNTATRSSISRPPNHGAIGRDPRISLSRGRVPHNLVERRYRDNLNHQIELLRLTIPSLRDAQPCTSADYEDLSSPRMPSKAVIIQTAATYIQDIQNERARLVATNQALQEQVSSLQQLVRCEEPNVLQYVNAMRTTAGL